MSVWDHLCVQGCTFLYPEKQAIKKILPLFEKIQVNLAVLKISTISCLKSETKVLCTLVIYKKSQKTNDIIFDGKILKEKSKIKENWRYKFKPSFWCSAPALLPLPGNHKLAYHFSILNIRSRITRSQTCIEKIKQTI